ncbi:MAG: TlpA family protein disulfide reductase [Acidobacteria bacterium]|nr:TlpA family protein disulfide reductase [Acidobacteriota bacterium]
MTPTPDPLPPPAAADAGAAPPPHGRSGRRWAIAAVAALALALLTFPMLTSNPGDVTHVADINLPENAVCSGEGAANYDFTLTGPDGDTVSLADYKGQVVLLNFWGTWCPPCRVEVPAFVEVQEAYRDRGFVIVGVAVEDTAEAVRAFASEMRINYPLAMTQDDIEHAYGPIYGLPLSYVIARDGSICRKHFGELTKERVEKEIAGLL